MQYREVLKVHNSVKADSSITDILGDAFLLNENPIYRKIRQEALKIGVQFSEADAPYLLLPFNQLDRIVVQKKVPFVPSGRMATEIEGKHPGVFDLTEMPLPESYHLHESAHVIAENCCSNLKAITNEEKILKSILCESFANTVDALACGYAETEIHKVFIKHNCYMSPTTKIAEKIDRVRSSLGEAIVFQVVFISYVYANFLREEVPKELIEKWAGGNAKAQKEVRSLSQIGQQLDPLFRLQTTQNYFKLLGFKGDVQDLLDFDFLKLLRREDFSEAIKAMSKVLQT